MFKSGENVVKSLNHYSWSCLLCNELRAKRLTPLKKVKEYRSDQEKSIWLLISQSKDICFALSTFALLDQRLGEKVKYKSKRAELQLLKP